MRYFPILLGIGVLLAVVVSSVWLDAAGRLASGTLVLKREVVTMHEQSWSRKFLVRVVYHPANVRPVMTDLTVNEKEFDRLQIGDTVQVRYLDLRIIPGTRLATRSTGTIIKDFFREILLPNSARPKNWLHAKARVVRTQRAGRRWFRPPLLIVQLAYTPEGYRNLVQAVEEIAPSPLKPGSEIAIEYDPEYPRLARIVAAGK